MRVQGSQFRVQGLGFRGLDFEGVQKFDPKPQTVQKSVFLALHFSYRKP